MTLGSESPLLGGVPVGVGIYTIHLNSDSVKSESEQNAMCDTAASFSFFNYFALYFVCFLYDLMMSLILSYDLWSHIVTPQLNCSMICRCQTVVCRSVFINVVFFLLLLSFDIFSILETGQHSAPNYLRMSEFSAKYAKYELLPKNPELRPRSRSSRLSAESESIFLDSESMLAIVPVPLLLHIRWCNKIDLTTSCSQLYNYG